MSEGYDANKSQIQEDKLADFLASDLQHDITSVPGIGPSGAGKLRDAGVHNTYQLMGQFLKLKDQTHSVKDHCDVMWYWLKEVGIKSHRSGIIQCIAEKCEIMMPGMYQTEGFFDAVSSGAP